MIKIMATMRAPVQPAKKPENFPINNIRLRDIIQMVREKKSFLYTKNMIVRMLPKENVVLCLCSLACGLKMFIPLLRFELAKCLMKAASTLSISLVTFTNIRAKQIHIQENKGWVNH